MSEHKNAKYDAICILGTMRTGSNLLERIMTQNPEIIGAGELFNPNFIFRRAMDNYHGISIEERNANPAKLLARAVEVNPSRLPLFRYFPDHIGEARDAILDNPRIAKIILKRNLVDSFISVEIARRNTQWIITRRDKHIPSVQFEFDEAQFQNWVETSTEFYDGVERQIAAQGQDFYVIEYENIKNYGMLDELAEFLGLQSGWPQFVEPLERQNPRAHKNYLTNPDILNSIELPKWQPREIPDRKSKPLIAQAYFAKNLNLIYVPIFGNANAQEREILSKFNQAELEEIKTDEVAGILQGNPNIRAYTRILHPMDRIYSIFMMHVLGEINGFDQDFRTLANETMEQNLKGYPKNNSVMAFDQIGLKNPRHIRKFLRNFIIETRKELWSGFRNHLLSDQYWPQDLIVENLAENFEITTLVGENFPERAPFEALASAPAIRDPLLNAPYDASEFRDSANIQIYDLYKEDYLTYGFPIKLE